VFDNETPSASHTPIGEIPYRTRGRSGSIWINESTYVRPRFGIATVLCFTATLLAGCAFALPKPEDGALGNRASGTGAGALVAQETGRRQENMGGQPEEVDRLARAAAFHDYGRYYK
jgi:hypothetical protein